MFVIASLLSCIQCITCHQTTLGLKCDLFMEKETILLSVLSVCSYIAKLFSPNKLYGDLFWNLPNFLRSKILSITFPHITITNTDLFFVHTSLQDYAWWWRQSILYPQYPKIFIFINYYKMQKLYYIFYNYVIIRIRKKICGPWFVSWWTLLYSMSNLKYMYYLPY